MGTTQSAEVKVYLIKLRIWVNFALTVPPIIKNVAREMNCECMGDKSHFFSYVLVPTSYVCSYIHK